jgi:predicted nucleic acid-binding protein
MIVVSDTTALTTLIKSGLEHVLPGLFGEVRIPRAVAQELRQFHPVLPTWCQIESAKESRVLDSLRIAVDAGEAEAIALALDLQADFVLLDDKKGRRQAEALGLTCLALPAVMVAAKRQGLISSVTEAFAILAAKGRYGVAESTAIVLLRSVGEA